jgi:hypothetical protein
MPFMTFNGFCYHERGTCCFIMPLFFPKLKASGSRFVSIGFPITCTCSLSPTLPLFFLPLFGCLLIYFTHGLFHVTNSQKTSNIALLNPENRFHVELSFYYLALSLHHHKYIWWTIHDPFLIFLIIIQYKHTHDYTIKHWKILYSFIKKEEDFLKKKKIHQE